MQHKTIFTFLTIFITIFGFCFGGQNLVLAQSSNQINKPNLPPSSQTLEAQAEVVKLKQASEADLQTLIANLNKENETLDRDIINLKNQQIQMETLDEKYTQNLDALQKQTIETNPNLENDISEAKKNLSETEKNLVTIKNDLADKQAKYDANTQSIKDAKTNLESKRQEVKQEVNTLQQQALIFGIQISYYVILIIAYWFVWELFRLLNRRLVKNELIRGFLNFILNTIAIIATLVTVLLAFIGNLTLLLTSLGVLSAALVVALQDFVSSFFAWIMIVVGRQYRVDDTITITTQHGVQTGKVTGIGIFRTTMRERVGGTGWDREQQTGRLLTFPNNLILKEPVTNHTRENDIIWHSYNVIITFESDHVKTRTVLESICEDQFKSALKNEKEYFRGIKNLAQFKPKLYMHISADGPQFTIWFATKIGHFRERAEKYSEDILTRFNKENIALAYTTSRIILNE